MKFRAALFDLDGTLVDSLSDIADSMNSVLLRNGFPSHDINDYRLFIGEGMRVLVKRALPQDFSDQDLIDFYTGQMKNEYAKRWNRKTRIYSGISELLTTMKNCHITLSVLSNKPHGFTVKMVEYYFGNSIFKQVMGAGQFPEKPNPAAALYIAQSINIDPSGFLYIGDSAVDMKTAKSAGMFACGCLWGFRGKEELISGGADRIVAVPDEISDMLD